MYLEYIYFMLRTLQIHLHMYVLNTQLYFWYTHLLYLKSAKFNN